MRSSSALECRRLSQEWESELAEFFTDLVRAGDERFFHPHPLTNRQAQELADYSGKDLYYVLTESKRVLGYGMLRGWDEGYEIPSLGIAIHPAGRRRGLGTLLMHFLHAAARLKGAKRIRLKVDSENLIAIDMYRRMGYSFDQTKEGECVGLFDCTLASGLGC